MKPETCIAPTAQKLAPATYCGFQEGFEDIAGIELWNLTADIKGHSAGSTVARQTLEGQGYFVPAAPVLV